LRDNDFQGRVVLFGQEQHLPYERPPLSKEFLAGKQTLADFTVDIAAWYREHDVDLRLEVRVASVDPFAHSVALVDGTTTRYDKLLLATGSRPLRR
jgi:3-phenylpropionate/trans-cinnamate dioxygenase ferredoxin reductase subunit